MPRPIHATIHTDALHHNLNRARQAASDARVWAVVLSPTDRFPSQGPAGHAVQSPAASSARKE